MKIKRFEQSGFVCTLDTGFSFAIDIGKYTDLDALSGMSVDAVLVSHIHSDHFSVPHIMALNPKYVYLSKECIDQLPEGQQFDFEIVEMFAEKTIDLDDGLVTVLPFDVDHGPNISVVPKQNFGFFIKTPGTTIYFAGDMFYNSGISILDLDVDVALIPIGGFYTFDPKEAAGFIKDFGYIGALMPMHYDHCEKKQEVLHEFLEMVKDSPSEIVIGDFEN